MRARHAERRLAAARALLALVVAWPLVTAAQRDPAPRFEDAPLPPRIDDVAPDAGAERALAAPPNRARLAPLPAERVEEIVVTAENRWRLPDLGSEWRAERDAELAHRRYIFSLFPREQTVQLTDNPFLIHPDAARSVPIFIWRPGSRNAEEEDGER